MIVDSGLGSPPPTHCWTLPCPRFNLIMVLLKDAWLMSLQNTSIHRLMMRATLSPISTKITDHKRDDTVVMKSSDAPVRPTTKGWQLLVEFKDGSFEWM